MGSCCFKNTAEFADPQYSCCLNIDNYTWGKDVDGLFDYNSSDIKHSTLQARHSAIMFLKAGHLSLLNKNTCQLLPQCSLFQICRQNSNFLVMPIKTDSLNRKHIWLAVKSTPSQMHKLISKDFIKLGKQVLKVIQIVLQENDESKLNGFIQTAKEIYDDLDYVAENHYLSKKPIEQGKVVSTGDQICRICLEGGQKYNPLIKPCNCTGTIRYIHLKCIRLELANKVKPLKNTQCFIVDWKRLRCQMCKSEYKEKIYLDNKKYQTVCIQKPKCPYMVLELKRRDDFSRIHYFVSASQKKKLSLGRKKDADIPIFEDVSVSRHHANILFQQNAFYLEDNKSKFGTLLLIKRNALIRPNISPLIIQVDSKVFALSIGIPGSNRNLEQPFLNVETEEQVEEQRSNMGSEKKCNKPKSNNSVNQEVQLDERQYSSEVGLANDSNLQMSPLRRRETRVENLD